MIGVGNEEEGSGLDEPMVTLSSHLISQLWRLRLNNLPSEL